METSVRDYVTEKPGTDYHAIKIRFGTPREIASSYVEEMETPELIKNLRIRRKIVCIVAAAAVAIVLLWAGVVSIALANSYNRANGYMTEQVVEVERTEQEGG